MLKRLILSVLLLAQNTFAITPAQRVVINQGPLSSITAARAYIRSTKPTMFLDPDYVQSVTQSSVGLVSSLATLYGSTAAFTQGTDANKPILSRPDRVENLVTQSEVLSSVVRATVSANSTTNPVNGATTADTCIEDATAASTHYCYDAADMVSGLTYRLSLYAKPKERTFLAVRFQAASGVLNDDTYFNLSDCTVGTKGADIITATSTSVGSGWCKLEMTAISSATGTGYLSYQIADSISNYSYSGDGASGLYLFGRQLQRSSMQPTYIATTTAPVYGSLTGRRMLTFDGSNDTMASTSLYSDIFGASAKTIFAVGHSSGYTATQNILSDNAGSNGRLVYHHGSGYIGLRNNDGGAVANAPLAPPSANTPIALMSWHDGTNLFSAFNRGAVASVASGATSSMAGSLKLGSTGSAEYWNGQLGPIITYNRVLTQPERDMIRQILQKFWRVN